ncbi:hypothetical protein C0099_08585 [Pseudazoarcus pumilus]|uniref:Bacteriophage tail tape measure C-terminal domain-containing protein n=2 Tax=Pseudazoarcus pumilus TaxID=2067960 RepID=A0A2I6S6V3_9RHOO|nr:hypothetical protein C0099_08585 [Pseudazoarcus pumilus]
MKTGSFETDTKRAEKRLDAMRRQAERTGKAIGTAMVVGATAAVTAMTMMVNRSRQMIDEQAKLAQRLNTTSGVMEVLRRAGEMAGVGLSQVESASQRLDVAIGKAIQGSKTQADAFDRLGITAQELAALPLDERIAAVNKALRENVAAAERGAVAAELFGTKNAAAMRMLDNGTIAEAGRQVDIFGTKLSEIDAAKVELANDAMGTFDLFVEGISKRLTVELSPALRQIGEDFLNAADEAGGLGSAVEDAVDSTLRSLAFVIDAFDGVNRSVRLSWQTFKMMTYGVSGLMLDLAESIVNGPLRAVNFLIEQMNRVPGLEIGPVRTSGLGAAIQSDLAAARENFGAAQAEFARLMETPLAGTAMLDWWAQARDAGQAAAEAAVAGRRAHEDSKGAADTAGDAVDRVTSSIRSQVDAVQQQIDALTKQAMTFGMSNTELQLFELRMAGASEAQLGMARGLLESIEAMERAADEQSRLNELLNATPTAMLERTREDMLLLDQAFRRGRISVDEYVEAVQTRLGTLPDTMGKVGDAMTTYADQAARNMQDAMGDFFYSVGRGSDDIARKFIDNIHRMASELVASQLLGFLGRGFAGSGGWLGALGSAMVAGARADGGPVAGGSAYLVGERGPELFVPNTAGRVLPNEAITSSARSETNVRVVNAIDPALVGEYMGSTPGEKIIMNVIRRNRSSVAGMLGS